MGPRSSCPHGNCHGLAGDQGLFLLGILAKKKADYSVLGKELWERACLRRLNFSREPLADN